jgi:hypothetical protein
MSVIHTPIITTPTTDEDQPELKDSERLANVHQPKNYREEIEDEKLRLNPDRNGIASPTDLDGEDD